MRSSATRAQCFTSSFTLIWFTTLPSTRFSKRPAQMLRRDTKHGRAQAAGIVERNDFLALGRKLFAHAIDQMDFRAHGEHGSRRRVTDHLQQTLGGANAIGFLADFPAALGMHDHANSRIFCAHVVDMFGQESAGAPSSGLSRGSLFAARSRSGVSPPFNM